MGTQVLMGAGVGLGDNVSSSQQELSQNLVPTPAITPHIPPSSPMGPFGLGFGMQKQANPAFLCTCWVLPKLEAYGENQCNSF